jgi:pilus assembly protein FimV
LREPAEPVVSAPPVEDVESPPPAAPQAEAESEPPVAVESTPSARAPAGDEYGPVRNGETLWGIASDWSRGTGMDINKVMIAIQRENPRAFMKNNINLLKRGAILRMPAVDDINTISSAAAFSEVSTQTDEFRGRSTVEPVASPATPLLAEESAVPAPEDKPPAEAGEVAPEISDGQQEPETTDAVPETADVSPQLELVPPSLDSELDSAYGFEETDDSSIEAEASVSTLREDLARKEEELINQQAQNTYLEERIKELESQLATVEEGNVEDSDLANMEQRIREERLAEAAAKEEAAARPKPRESSRQSDKAPWYSNFMVWLIGFLVLAAALVGWLLSRRGGDEFVSDLGSEEGQLREIKDEAEEVLRVLEDPRESDAEAADEDAEVPDEDAEATVIQDLPEQSAAILEEDAEILDEESSDPEIQLDLARAYISMGDKEAARVILEEVAQNGSEEQQAEAASMMDQL